MTGMLDRVRPEQISSGHVITFRVPNWVLAELDLLRAERRDCPTRSTIVREQLALALDRAAEQRAERERRAQSAALQAERAARSLAARERAARQAARAAEKAAARAAERELERPPEL